MPYEWIQTTLPNSNWTSVASNGEGNILLAVDSENIYISKNFGTNWEILKAIEDPEVHIHISINDTGRYIFYIYGKSLYISQNFGNSFHEIKINKGVLGDTSIDYLGENMYATAYELIDDLYYNYVYVSNDYGNTWKLTFEETNINRITSIASAGNSGCVYVAFNTKILVSTNYGNKFIDKITTKSLFLAANYSGEYLINGSTSDTINGRFFYQNFVYCVNKIKIHTNGYGYNYVIINDVGNIMGITISQNDTTESSIYTSEDFGVNWTTNSPIKEYKSLACNKNGTLIIACTTNEYVYVGKYVNV